MKNCWEILNCGREPNGHSASEYDLCPVFSTKDNVNSGNFGGRICWAIAGTFCGGIKQGTFSEKALSCMTCKVFKQVKREEGSNFKLLLHGQKYQRTSNTIKFFETQTVNN